MLNRGSSNPSKQPNNFDCIFGNRSKNCVESILSQHFSSNFNFRIEIRNTAISRRIFVVELFGWGFGFSLKKRVRKMVTRHIYLEFEIRFGFRWKNCFGYKLSRHFGEKFEIIRISAIPALYTAILTAHDTKIAQ